MTRWLLAPCVLAAGTVLLAADDKKEADDKGSAKFQVTRLEVRKYPPPKPGAFAFVNNGITMDVLIRPSDKNLTGIDFKASKLESFTDDKKNNLYKKAIGFGFGASDWLNEYGTQYAAEGDAVTVQMRTSVPPGKGAESLLVKASLVVRIGKDEKATEKKEIALKANEEAIVGPFKVKVSQFGNQFNVISAEENLKSIELADDKGKELKIGPPGRSRMTKGDKMEYMYSFFIFQKTPKFSIKINYYDKVENVKMPMDLKVGLGLE
ncbi:MAG TPA: hypothetical protein VMG10_17680 [Gemmataceae bacterium]|nr:hypothetical protein [Gemmataceae bacterium]